MGMLATGEMSAPTTTVRNRRRPSGEKPERYHVVVVGREGLKRSLKRPRVACERNLGLLVSGQRRLRELVQENPAWFEGP